MSSDVAHAIEQPPSAPAFTYDRFQDASREIRLVEINELRGGILNLKLSVHKKVDAPEYNAISYTWSDGGAPRWVEITVNDKAMQVTENCRYALEQAYSHIQPNQPCITHFWIDSICIDQSSDLEKQHQVAMMADIYAQAVKVLSCVGCHRDNSEDLAQVLKAARAFARKRLKSGRFPHNAEKYWFIREDDSTRAVVKSFVLYQLAALESPTIYPFFGRFMQSFFDFSERCYWTRLWIVQEVAASKQLEVLCGSDKFSRPDIYLLHWIATCYYYSLFTEERITPLSTFYNYETGEKEHGDTDYSFLKFVLSRNSKVKIQASDIFSLRSKFGCSRPEDRVYGMLNLVNWPIVDPPIVVEPVYQPSAPVDLAELFVYLYGHYKAIKFPEIFEGLEIYHHQVQIERLIAERSVHTLASQRQPGEYPARTYSCRIRRCEILSRSNMDRLTTDLDRIKTAVDDIHSTPNLNTTVSQFLYSGSSIAGMLCSSAREDDLIIQTPFGKSLLVLRSTRTLNEYEIIGQGLLLAGFELPRERPRYPNTLEEQAQARTDCHIRHLLTDGDPWTGDFEAYKRDFELCRQYLQELYQKLSKEMISEERPHLVTTWRRFTDETSQCVSRMLQDAIWTRDRTAYSKDLTLWHQYLEALYREITERPVLGEEPHLSMVVTEMTLSWMRSGEQCDPEVPRKESRQNALRYISCLLERIDVNQQMKIRWDKSFALQLEPLEMLLLACQDLEKAGIRNEGKRMQRLTTRVHGIVLGGYIDEISYCYGSHS